MESFQQQALDFDVPAGDFDPNSEPENGEQYLQRVFYERTNCPSIVVKPFPSITTTATTTQSTAEIKSTNVWNRYANVTFLKIIFCIFISLSIF